MWNRWRGMRQALGLVLFVVVVASGCGSDELKSPTAARLRGLANMYLDYAVAKNGKGPAREQEFKKHLRSQPGFVLETNGLDPKAIDAAFVSLRDEEPFVILYGLTISQISGNSTQVIAHEKTGKNSKRLIVFTSGKVEHVNESRFQELISAKP